MIWLTWRQFRVQALVALIFLAVLAAALLYLGVQIRADYTRDVLNCVPTDCTTSRRSFGNRYGGAVSMLGVLLLAVPGLIGTFWGAPMVARELEGRTDRLVWNQSVTRSRWLTVKLLVLGGSAVAVTGLFSLLLTWSASRYDQFAGERFAAMNFAARNVVPLGYAAFAFVLGVVAGVLIRRTVPAMAVVVGVFAVVQVVFPTFVRAHLMSPMTTTVAFDRSVMDHADGFGMNQQGARISGYTMPGAWSMGSETAVLNADGSPFTSTQASHCMHGDPDADFACMAEQHLHFVYLYQPGSRYWPFQWIELSAYLVLTALLSAFALLWIRRRIS